MVIENYINYYNHQRIKVKLKRLVLYNTESNPFWGLTVLEYYSFKITKNILFPKKVNFLYHFWYYVCVCFYKIEKFYKQYEVFLRQLAAIL